MDKIEEIGYCISIKGDEVWCDFGDKTPILSMLKIMFHDEKKAWEVYCNKIKITIEVI